MHRGRPNTFFFPALRFIILALLIFISFWFRVLFAESVADSRMFDFVLFMISLLRIQKKNDPTGYEMTKHLAEAERDASILISFVETQTERWSPWSADFGYQLAAAQFSRTRSFPVNEFCSIKIKNVGKFNESELIYAEYGVTQYSHGILLLLTIWIVTSLSFNDCNWACSCDPVIQLTIWLNAWTVYENVTTGSLR